MDRRDLERALSRASEWVRAEFSFMEDAAAGLGCERRVESGPGVSYRLGGTVIGRAHPKQGHLGVGIPERMRADVEALTGREREEPVCSPVAKIGSGIPYRWRGDRTYHSGEGRGDLAPQKTPGLKSSLKEGATVSGDRDIHREGDRRVSLDQGATAADRTIRMGLWAIPAAALLIGAHWFFPEGAQTPDGIARHFTSVVVVIVQEYVLLLGGLVVLLLGVVALSAHLFNAGARTSAIAGMTLSISGIALFLAIVAIPTIVYPMLGQLYLSDHHEVAIAMDVFNPRNRVQWLQTHLIVMLVLSIGGATAMAVAVWRSRSLPRWTGVLYAIGFVLTLTDIPIISFVGLILLIVAGVRVAMRPDLPRRNLS